MTCVCGKAVSSRRRSRISGPSRADASRLRVDEVTPGDPDRRPEELAGPDQGVVRAGRQERPDVEEPGSRRRGSGPLTWLSDWSSNQNGSLASLTSKCR